MFEVPWIFGGDLNSITLDKQPYWGPADPLDHTSPYIEIPARTSADLRPISSHGRRLLNTLSGRGILLNGISCLGFTDSYTRMPTKEADRPGVLDYVCAPLRMLSWLVSGGLQVVATPPDPSDHWPVVLDLCLPIEQEAATENVQGQQSYLDMNLKSCACQIPRRSGKMFVSQLSAQLNGSSWSET